MKYFDIYQKRLNRYGNNIQERTKNQRILFFDRYKAQSVYQIPFKEDTAVFEPYKQNESKDLHYLLTNLDIELKSGEYYNLKDFEGNNLGDWMVFYLDENHSRGYNKYIMLRLTHEISVNGKGDFLAYYYGPMERTIQDLIASKKADILYEDKDKDAHIIMPKLEVKKDDYIIINGMEDEPYLVTGFDKTSIPGVIYISLNETLVREKQKIDSEETSQIWI